MRNIATARNAIIFAEANQSVKTMLNRKAPGRFLNHFYVGPSVQIAIGKSRTGTYRAQSVLGRNLILERGPDFQMAEVQIALDS